MEREILRVSCSLFSGKSGWWTSSGLRHCFSSINELYLWIRSKKVVSFPMYNNLKKLRIRFRTFITFCKGRTTFVKVTYFSSKFSRVIYNSLLKIQEGNETNWQMANFVGSYTSLNDAAVGLCAQLYIVWRGIHSRVYVVSSFVYNF